jgi:cytoplasmic iron level regulating protein YaaA (DUF328/UPF0246 family)
MIVLLSPAKSLDFESHPTVQNSSKLLFSQDAEYLANKLKKVSAKRLKSMMNISDDLAQLNADRYARWSYPFDDENSKQAIFAFDGDVYHGLQALTLSEKEVMYAQDHLRIISGLYGLLRPLDRIQPYRLEMGTSWKVTPTKTNLYKYWGDKLTRSLQKQVDETGSNVVLNLASQEYAKAIQFKNLSVPVVSPSFKEEKGDKYQMISFFSKKARGLMAKYVIEHQIKKVDDLQGFDYEGYHLNQALSEISNNQWVFTRKYKSNQ